VNVYPFIEAEKARQHSVQRACELLKVSRYYAHAATRAAGGSPRQRPDAELVERIRHHHTASKGRNGAPRIHADLAAEGRRHGRKRVARLMRVHGIIGKHRRRTRTPPSPTRPRRPVDLVAGHRCEVTLAHRTRRPQPAGRGTAPSRRHAGYQGAPTTDQTHTSPRPPRPEKPLMLTTTCGQLAGGHHMR
jgi:HTH-like domain